MGLSYRNEPPLETITEHRYFPGSASAPARTKKKPYVKKCCCQACRTERQEQFLKELEKNGGSNTRQQGPRAGVEVHDVDKEEDWDLARGGEPLPGDFRDATSNFRSGHFALKKRPSLSREEAFRDPTTSRSNSRQNSWCGQDDGNAKEELEIAELYRLGILYDDEHLRGSGFNLDSIVHDDQPVYSIRPAKRQRKSSKAAKSHFFDEISLIGSEFGNNNLPLDLSFAELGRDEVIANYLISNPDFKFEGIDDEANSESFAFAGGRHSRNESRATVSTAPITVIYEVDNEEEDGEIAEIEEAPGIDEVPELTQASQTSELEEEGWALLPTPPLSRVQTTSLAEDGVSVSGSENDGDAPGGGGAQENWIVLGDDS